MRGTPDSPTLRLDEVEVLCGRAPNLRIFVGSQIRGDVLKVERHAVGSVLHDLDGVAPWRWEEQAVAGPYSAEEFCVRAARTSDALVLVVGQSLTRVTRAEFEAARAAGVPVFLFVKEGLERDAEVDQLVEEVRESGFITQDFTSAADLAANVVRAIRHHFSYVWRLSILATRRSAQFVAGGGEFAASPGSTGVLPVARANGGWVEFVEQLAGHLEGLSDLERTLTLGRMLEEAATLRLATVAASLLPQLTLDVEQLTQSDRAWVLNARGLAQAVMGQGEAARESFDEMRTIGSALGDDRLVGTALQNLGVLACEDEPEQAHRLLRDAIEVVARYGDDYQLAQMKLNQVNVLFGSGDLASAEALLDDLERDVRPYGGHLLAAVNGSRGLVAAQRGEYREAEVLFQRTLGSARRRGDVEDAILAWQNLAAVADQDGRHTTALARLNRAIDAAQHLGWVTKLADLQQAAGATAVSAGDHESAVHHFDRSRQGYAESADAHAAARATADLGAALALSGRLGESKERLTEALGPLTVAGDCEWEARVLANLAAISDEESDHAVAVQYLDRAVSTLGDDHVEMSIELLWDVAHVALALRSTADRAHVYLQRRGELLERAFDPATAAWEVAGGAKLLAGAERFEEAFALFEDATSRAEEARDDTLLFHVTNELGCTLVQARREREALVVFSSCRDLAVTLGSPELELKAAHNLTEAARRTGDLGRAERDARRAMEIADSLADPSAMASTANELASVFVDLERWEEAQECFRTALSVDGAEPGDRATAWVGLGNVAFLRADFSEAVTAFGRARALYRNLPDDGYVSMLGAVLEAQIARGDTRLRCRVQRLVDRAEERGCHDVAIESLARCARRLLSQGREDHALALYAAASVLGGTRRRGETDPQYLLEGLGQAMLWPAVHVVEDRGDVTSVMAGLVERVVSDYRLPRELVEQLADLATETARDYQAA